MSISKLNSTLKKEPHIIAEGRMREASINTSHMWTPEPEPRKDHSGVVMPTRAERPVLPQPPLSWNCVKICLAGAC